MSNVEYLGINVSRDGKIERKLYRFWSEDLNHLIPHDLKGFLHPFDFCERSSEGDISVSAFVDLDAADSLEALLMWLSNIVDDVIGLKRVWNDFSSIMDFDNNLHYNPIISFKYTSKHIKRVTLYVSPLKDKSFMKDYLDKTISNIGLPLRSGLLDFVVESIGSKYCDLYLVGFDYDISQSTYQKKIYLKMKHQEFIGRLTRFFPDLLNFMSVDNYRFSELALCWTNSNIEKFNLYFKPIRHYNGL